MSLFAEFKKFAVKGSVVELAIGIVIGTAFGKVVSSFVDDIIMPLVNPLIPGGKWQTVEIWPGIKLGSFGSAILTFVIVSFALFLVFKFINAVRKKEDAVPPAPTATEKLLVEIRDALVNRPRP